MQLYAKCTVAATEHRRNKMHSLRAFHRPPAAGLREDMESVSAGAGGAPEEAEVDQPSEPIEEPPPDESKLLRVMATPSTPFEDDAFEDGASFLPCLVNVLPIQSVRTP